MKKLIPFLAFIIVFAACTGKTGNKIESLKKKIDAKKEQRSKLDTEISDLEKQLAEIDTTTAKTDYKFVSVIEVKPDTFLHYIEIQGMVDAEKDVTVTPQMGGEVKSINVVEGQQVTQGQVMAELDNDAFKSGISELQSQLDFVTTVYTKQKNLWDQQIGSEIQYLTAKNNKEALEKKMATLQQQLEMSQIKAPFTGTVDAVDLKIGQMAAPGVPGTGIRVVDPSSLKVIAEVAESYSGSVKKGNNVKIAFPDLNREIDSKLSHVENTIKNLTRTFTVTAPLDDKKNSDYRPNMIAVLKIQDYVNKSVLVIPVNSVHHSAEGDFVYVATDDKGKSVAKKVTVHTGKSYGEKTEVLDGLQPGMKVITAGNQDLTEGEAVQF